MDVSDVVLARFSRRGFFFLRRMSGFWLWFSVFGGVLGGFGWAGGRFSVGSEGKGGDTGGGSSDEEELVDDGAGVMVHKNEVAPKIKSKVGRVIMGHTVICCLRRCNRVNSKNFSIEV